MLMCLTTVREQQDTQGYVRWRRGLEGDLVSEPSVILLQSVLTFVEQLGSPMVLECGVCVAYGAPWAVATEFVGPEVLFR